MIIYHLWKSSANTEGKSGDVEGNSDVLEGNSSDVEGNSGDACRQRSYPVGNSSIYGYGIPAY